MVMCVFCFCVDIGLKSAARNASPGRRCCSRERSECFCVFVFDPCFVQPAVVVAGGAPVPLMAGVPANVYYAPMIVTTMPGFRFFFFFWVFLGCFVENWLSGKPPRGRAVHPEWNPAADAAR